MLVTSLQTIKDPKAAKPEDWDEREEIADPEDKKPEGWDDIPATIADPDAKKPEDWDDEEDGECLYRVSLQANEGYKTCFLWPNLHAAPDPLNRITCVKTASVVARAYRIMHSFRIMPVLAASLRVILVLILGVCHGLFLQAPGRPQPSPTQSTRVSGSQR